VGSSRSGGLALIVSGIAGFVWFALELVPQGLGFEDTDSPAVALRYLRLRPEVYAQIGVVLLVQALALLVGVLAVAERLHARVDPLALRAATASGLLAAALFFMMGVLRLGVRPLLYINSLDETWGETAYLVQQIAGVHGVGQGAVFALAIWSTAIGVIGWRSRTLPRALCLFAFFPALRIVGIGGPFGITLGIPWILFMAAIPASQLWVALLGGVLLRGREAS